MPKLDKMQNWRRKQLVFQNDEVLGEILVNRFYNDGNGHHFDVTANDIFADSYIISCLFVLEVLDWFTDEFKHVLQKIGDKLATVKKMKHAKMMNRIRKKMIASLMKYNAKLIASSMLID